MAADTRSDTGSAPSGPSGASDFSCSICFDVATEPVVTKCGHLYCWGCLEEWLQRQPECPLCKGHIDANVVGDVIPLYGKGSKVGAHSARRPPPPPSASPSDHSSDQRHGIGSSGGGENGGTPQAAPHAPRPAGNREEPLPQPRGGVRFNMRQHGGWGGGMFLLSGTHAVIPWEFMLFVGVLVLAYNFLPWRAWLGLERRQMPPGDAGRPDERPRPEGGEGAAGGEAANAPRGLVWDANMQSVALLVLLFTILVAVLGN